jgi:TPR repeat protein
MIRKMLGRLVALFLAAWPLSAHADLLQNGMNASRAGDYADAITDWTTLAEQGNPTAEALLGNAYLMGRGVPPDGKAGLHWIQLAANAGNALAQFDLGATYANGALGLPKDFGTAVYWFQLAAAQGQIQAQLSLAQIYYGGQGVPRDYRQAFHWFQIAADKGELHAAFALGSMYLLGQGTTEDDQLAYIWMTIAAMHMPDPALRQKYAHFDDMAAAKLDDAEIAAARARAAKWCPCGAAP